MPQVLLIGQGPTAATALQSLIDRCEVVGVARRTESDDAVARRAAAARIPVFNDVSMRGIERLVVELHPDCVVVSSYDRILGPGLLARCPFVNVHYAPLPEYRGRATVNWALINGEPCTAITIHVLSPDLDGGDILFQQRVPTTVRDTVADLYARLNSIQLEVLGTTVEQFLEGTAGQPQDAGQATYCCTRVPDDGEIDWTWSTARIDALVRALVAPFPGAFSYLGGRRLRIWRTAPRTDGPRYVGRVPGRVVGVSNSGEWVDVLTGDGILRLFDVQLDDEPVAAAATIIASVRATLGLRHRDVLDRVRALEERIAGLSDSLQALSDLVAEQTMHKETR